MSREKKNAEKRDAIKTDRALDSNKENCSVCGASIAASAMDVHKALAH